MTIRFNSLSTKLIAAHSAAFAIGTANASIEEQFTSCALQAMATQSISAKKVSIDLPTNSKVVLDHGSSSVTDEYVMKLINQRTGQDLGKISCNVSAEGEVRSVRYLSKN